MILNKGHLWCFSHKILKNHIFYVLYLFAPEYQKNSLILAVLFAQTLFLNVWHFMTCHEVELRRKISSNILQLIWLILIRSLTLLGMKRGKCISNPKIAKSHIWTHINPKIQCEIPSHKNEKILFHVESSIFLDYFLLNHLRFIYTFCDPYLRF